MGSCGNNQWNPNGLIYYNDMYYTQDNGEWIIPYDPWVIHIDVLVIT